MWPFAKVFLRQWRGHRANASAPCQQLRASLCDPKRSRPVRGSAVHVLCLSKRTTHLPKRADWLDACILRKSGRCPEAWRGNCIQKGIAKHSAAENKSGRCPAARAVSSGGGEKAAELAPERAGKDGIREMGRDVFFVGRMFADRYMGQSENTTRPDLVGPDWIRLGLAEPSFTWPDLAWPVLARPRMTRPGLTWRGLVWLVRKHHQT